ncbi:MAG: 23S rRNA (pseudouridine(1915)-N(3))-methyltransferase RlmH [Firmicutes bacterium]|nr:23S rRNA (pseudouridine(1915)-N(3))-methyltransferase RlmH [Bacillota bacterium]
MQITILAVGKLKEKYLKEGLAEYAKRLTGVAKVRIIETGEENGSAYPSQAEIIQLKEREGKKLLAAIPEGCWKIVLDSRGKTLTSEDFAAHLQHRMLQGVSHFAFIIGGSWGLGQNVIDQADLLLSFGSFTYPHQLMRLILLEQVYRAVKIIRAEPYHK